MKEMLGMEKNKKILMIVSICSILLVLLGIYIVFFSTPKPVFLAMTDKINSKVLNTVNQNMSLISVYDNDYVSNVDAEYYIETNKGEKTTVINEQTGEEETIINMPPYIKILENKFNAYINKNKQNTHNAITLTVPNEQGSSIYNVYEKNGQFVLDIPQGDKFVVLNNEPVKFSDANSTLVKNIITMYERFYNQLKKNLPQQNFYKIELDDNKNKHGISITENELKTVLINVLQQLKEDTKFIQAYMQYKKTENINLEVTEDIVYQDIDNMIENLKTREVDESLQYELCITTQGILNKDILEIEMVKTSNSVIVNEIHFFINENNIKVDFMENAKNILQLDTVINEAGFNVKVTNENMNINVVFNDYYVSKEVVVQGNVGNKKVNGKYRIDIDENNNQVINSFQLNVDENDKKVIYINLYSKTDVKAENQYINTKTDYKKDEINSEEQQYVEQFYVDAVDKLGLER